MPLDKDKTIAADDAKSLLAIMGAYYPTKSALRIATKGQINPFSPINISVLGGTKNYRTISPTQGLDSFDAQTNAIADAINTAPDKPTIWDRLFKIKAKPHKLYTKVVKDGQIVDMIPETRRNLERMLSKSHGVIQVGTAPLEHEWQSMLKRRNMPRYRGLTDFGPGNFNQPEQWLGGVNWMKIQDNPKSYTRFIVPGGDHLPLGPGHQAAKASINTNSIPVSHAFRNASFSNAALRRPTASLTMGGGAGGFLLFEDAVKRVVDTKKGPISIYDPNKLNVIDDIVSAMKAKHGDNFRLNIFMGNQKANRGMYTFLRRLQTMQKRGDPRFANVKFHGFISQPRLAKYYGLSDYLFQMPGSTTAELMAMKGTPGKVINIVPNETHWWMPKHFSTNAKFVEHAMPGARSLNIQAKNRAGMLSKFIQEGRESMAPVQRRIADFSKVRALIKQDVIATRFGNLAKMTGSATAALALASYALRKPIGKAYTRYKRKRNWDKLLKALGLRK